MSFRSRPSPRSSHFEIRLILALVCPPRAALDQAIDSITGGWDVRLYWMCSCRTPRANDGGRLSIRETEDIFQAEPFSTSSARKDCKRRHGPAELPSFPAAPLPGRDRRAFARGRRLADPWHLREDPERPGRARKGRGRRSREEGRALGSYRPPLRYLILTTGAYHSYFGHDEWAMNAPGLKRIIDATEIRKRILLA